MNQWKMLLSTLITWGSSAAIMFGGIVPYIPQYYDIKQTENAEGFSLYVCLVLLIANTLRILFWFGHWFELPLLIQSIIMNITMMTLIHLCVSVQNRGQITQKKEHLFTDFEFEYFWAWTDSQSYLEFMLTFTTVGCVLLYMFIDYPLFVEFLGFLSVSVEAMLGVPQFYRNLSSKSTFGMSRKMVLMWFLGDSFKTVYYFVREVPLQFLIFGCLQIVIDISILSQCYFYRKKNANLMNWVTSIKN